MRVALVVTGGFDRSGRERVIPSLLWLVERLAREHDVFVYVLRYHDTPASYPLAGATIRDLGRPSGFVRQVAALAAAMRRDGRFDLVHAYWVQPAGRAAVVVAKTRRIPCVLTLDSGEFVSLPTLPYGLQSGAASRLAVRLASRFASRVVVCSEFQAALARHHHIDPLVIPLGVDTRLFTPRTEIAHRPPFRLLHVASLNPVKDQATLIAATRWLIARGLDVTLDVVGEDTMGGRLQSLVRQWQLEPRITFRGFLPSADLVALYHAAHLFVLPSLHEAAGVVLLEAASCGVPVAGTPVGYLADWSPHAATTVPRGDPEALGAAIAALLGDDTRLRATAAAAQQWARAHDADWTAQQVAALYRHLVTTRT